MPQIISPTSVEKVISGPLCDKAFLWFLATGGCIDRDPYNNLLEIVQKSHISLIYDDNLPPVFFHVGEHSTAADIFGKIWAAKSAGTMGLPDQPAEKHCNPAYYTAHNKKKLQSHYCHVRFNSHQSIFDLSYLRLLLPCLTKENVPLVLCVTDLLHIHKYN